MFLLLLLCVYFYTKVKYYHTIHSMHVRRNLYYRRLVEIHSLKMANLAAYLKSSSLLLLLLIITLIQVRYCD